MRVQVTLACTETGDRNYITKKNKRNNPDRIELKKYSPRLKRHTLHKETKEWKKKRLY
jgi:large subunit ribosomal protein L33